MRKVRTPVARLDALTPDTGKIVSLGESGGECALFLHQGRVYAVGALCPHQNAPLEGALAEKGRVVCKRHRYCFDLQTGDCLTIGGYGLPVFDVEIEDEIIYVSTWDFED